MVAKVTLSKAAILGADKTFLYGADIQYSAQQDNDYSLILQSLALGHDIVRFRIVNDTLQMVADQTYLFESDVNHPERLLGSTSTQVAQHARRPVVIVPVA